RRPLRSEFSPGPFRRWVGQLEYRSPKEVGKDIKKSIFLLRAHEVLLDTFFLALWLSRCWQRKTMSSWGNRQRHPRRRYLRLVGFLVASVAPPLPGNRAEAMITKIDIDSVQSPAFAGVSFGEAGRYEKLVGRAFGELEPTSPLNAVITDLALAPRN